MSRISLRDVVCGMWAAILFAGLAHAQGADAAIPDGLPNRLVCIFDKDAKQPHPKGMWLSGSAGTEILNAGLDKGCLLVSADKSSRLWWRFNQHTPLVLPHAWSSDPTMRVRLVLTSSHEYKGRISFGWITVKGDSAAIKREVLLHAGKAADLFLDLPVVADKHVAGFSLSFSNPITCRVRCIEIVALRHVTLNALPQDAFLRHDEVDVSGLVAGDIKNVLLSVRTSQYDGNELLLRKDIKVDDNKFSVRLAKKSLREFASLVITARAGESESKADSAMQVTTFCYPAITLKQPPRITVNNGRLYCGGKPFAFVGLNYTRFQLGVSRKIIYEQLARDVKHLKDWGVSVIRLTLNLGFIQPAEGIFPDHPRYGAVMAAHGLDPEFFRALTYFLDLAADNGIYTVFDWHETPTNPYRYFAGGNNHERGTGKPGTAIAWLCEDKTKRVAFDPAANQRHLAALLSTNTWMARYFKGRTGVMGIEVPYNEPHRAYVSIPSVWSRLVSQCCQAIKREDPELLTFANTPNWAHNTVSWASTWMAPFGLDGYGPHHYIANGPVSPRPEAGKTRLPWLCRDREKTFALSLPALFFASMTWMHPVYNGEGGEHGAEVFLPDQDLALAQELMYEASLAQCYAAGVAGHVNWTMLGSRPNLDIYRKHGPRFSRLLRAGPVDWSRAGVALVQNTEASPSGNGQNYACVPFVDLFLSLHLGPVHYLTDDLIIFSKLSRMSVGLEQVSRASADLGRYKAIVVDTRNLDQRVRRVLDNLKVPILYVDDPAKITLHSLADFLRRSGVAVDDRTPPGIQVAIGPARNILLYRRRGNGGRSRVYPMVDWPGKFRLLDESGECVFTGTAAELRENGFEIKLDKWRSAILHGVPVDEDAGGRHE